MIIKGLKGNYGIKRNNAKGKPYLKNMVLKCGFKI